MRIFSDFHHSGLYASLHYLLENRLGHELYRPIGNDWFTEGYWKIAEPYGNNQATVDQYLAVGNVPSDGTPGLNEVRYFYDDVHYIWDGVHGYHQKAIELDKFLSMNFDVIIASYPAHVRAYHNLINDHQLKAKLVYHIGNIDWHTHIPYDLVNNLMLSVKKFPITEKKNSVFYRQEFDEKIFYPATERPLNIITSFVNCLPNHQYFYSFKGIIEPEYEVKAYGIECPNGVISGVPELASIMRKSKFGYHYKPSGDGYGHVIHNWFACGRPVIVNYKDYKDKLAGELMVEDRTCISVDGRRTHELADVIRGISDLQYADMVNDVKKKYKEVVNFEEDAEKVKEFLNGLL